MRRIMVELVVSCRVEQCRRIVSALMVMQDEFIAHKIISMQESEDCLKSFRSNLIALFDGDYSAAQLGKDALGQVHALVTIAKAPVSVCSGWQGAQN